MVSGVYTGVLRENVRQVDIHRMKISMRAAERCPTATFSRPRHVIF